jgi:hypothetical protein
MTVDGGSLCKSCENGINENLWFHPDLEYKMTLLKVTNITLHRPDELVSNILAFLIEKRILNDQLSVT